MNKKDTLKNDAQMYRTHIFTADNYGDFERDGLIMRRVRGDKTATITITKSNEDVDGLYHITKDDAFKIIAGLRDVFDIASEERQMIELLQSQLEASQGLIESLSTVTVANIMFENGLRTAVLTPSRIVSGLTPALEIDATRPDQVKYILKEEPLNAQDTADNGRLDS